MADKSFIVVKFKHYSDSMKTKVFAVQDARGDELGTIQWHVPWRKYVFAPRAGTLYDEKCMREIAYACHELTEGHRNGIDEVPQFVMGPVRRELNCAGNQPVNDFMDRVKKSMWDAMSEDARVLYAAGVEFSYGARRDANGGYVMACWPTYECFIERDAAGAVVRVVEGCTRTPQPGGLDA
jgi:hypothetical protein